MLNQRVLWQGRQPRSTCIFQSASGNPPQLSCALGALPARGAYTEGFLSQHKQMDGWAAICKEQSQDLISSTVNCWEAVFITRDVKSMAPCRAATAHRCAGETLHLSRQLCWAYYMRHNRFCYNSQVSGNNTLPAPHFQCLTYQLHP